MFGTDNVVDKILGQGRRGERNPECPNFNGPRKFQNMHNMQNDFSLGTGFGNLTNNSNQILMKIKDLMDRLPEVKSAVGDLKLQLNNGETVNLKLNYKEGGI